MTHDDETAGPDPAPHTDTAPGSDTAPAADSAPGTDPGPLPDPAQATGAAAPTDARLIPVGRPLSAMRRPGRSAADGSGPGAQEAGGTQAGASDNSSFYDQIGGHETFAALTREFYIRVAQDERFRALYPEQDLGPAERRLRMFLEQYWGGPTTYSQERGHPRLRMRHMPFTVDAWARDTWLRHMRGAVESLELAPLHEGILWDYLERAAHSLLNTPG